MLKRNCNAQNLIEYKRLQGNLRRVVKNAKRDLRRNFCNSAGRQTKINQEWSMIREMIGIKRDYRYPILSDGDITAIRNEEKANIMAKSFAKIHSSDKIDGKEKKKRTDIGREWIIIKTRGRY